MCRDEGGGVCVKGRQCKKGSVCIYMYIESDKNRAAVKQQPHVYIGRCTI